MASVALSAALFCSGAAQAQLLSFTHYTTESESRALPSAEIPSVYQDRLGYLWIAVYSSGLIRYDGSQMHRYDEGDGLKSVAVWDMIEDATGRLWVSTNGGVFASEEPLQAYEKGRRIQFTTRLGGVPLLDVGVRRNVMAVDTQGRLWVGADALGLVRYTPTQDGLLADTLRVPPAPGETSRPVRSVVARQNGSVWVGLSGGGLVRYADGVSEEVVGDGLPSSTVSTLYEAPSGVLWGGEGSGRLWRLEEQGNGYRYVTVSESLSNTVNSIVVTSQGHLLAASGGSGVLRMAIHGRNAQPQRLTRENGLLSDVVNDLIEDNEGNVWVAQTGGLSKLRYNYSAFASYTAQSAIGEWPLLPAPSVSAIEPAYGRGPCDFWAGTAGGVACVQRGPPARSQYIQTANGLANDYVNGLAYDAEGRLWIGTPAGIDVVAPVGVPLPAASKSQPLSLYGSAYRVATYQDRTPTVLAVVPIRLARSDRDTTRVETVWFAANKFLFVLAEGDWFRFGTAAGLPSTVFHTVAADDAGRLWVGTRDHGLYRSTRPVTLAALRELAASGPSGEALSPLGREVNAPLFEPVWSRESDAVTDQIEALRWVEGAMWAATPAGVFVFASGPSADLQPVAWFDKNNGLEAQHVFSLDVSPTTGRLWIGTNAGLVEIDPAEREIVSSVTRRDGLVDNEVWYYGSVRTDERGRVHFGTAKGVTVYDPALDRANPEPPVLHLRRVDVVSSADGYNEVSFEYAATSFANESAVRYRTRLAGYESAWSAPTPEGKIRYTNLPAAFWPRPYTFQVIASNGQGDWTPEPLTYTFNVTPRWWLRWWAFGAYALMTLASGVALVRAQRARLIKRVRERARIREAEFRAEHALAEQAAAEARAQALQAENERKESELAKAHELEQAYNELQTTQAQLIQAEKMASLGQLTAGIAHEIKNPLNFVNNFAKISVELAEELREELEARRSQPVGEVIDEVAEIIDDLARNAGKIEEHGQRADRIVRAMLDHSRGGGGTFQKTDFNTLVSEYINLSYHGMRANVPGFNVTIEKNLDERIGPIELVPQEFGRVLINILNNAFYALHRYKEERDAEYVPTVTARTHPTREGVELRLQDNGPGIPDALARRVFEPFFTTKPPGEGTGLGLSLSYDIVTQMHGGTIHLETEDHAGTTFVITLPVTQDRRAMPSGDGSAPLLSDTA